MIEWFVKYFNPLLPIRSIGFCGHTFDQCDRCAHAHLSSLWHYVDDASTGVEPALWILLEDLCGDLLTLEFFQSFHKNLFNDSLVNSRIFFTDRAVLQSTISISMLTFFAPGCFVRYFLSDTESPTTVPFPRKAWLSTQIARTEFTRVIFGTEYSLSK